MEQLKSLLARLLRNTLDKVSVIYNLEKMKVKFDDEASFVVLKYTLQLHVVINLSREVLDNSDNGYYATLKKETEDLLEFHHQKLEKQNFTCCLVGCLFKCNRHRFYIRHLQHSHSRDSTFVCQFALKCTSTFSSLDLLLQHINNEHRISASPSIEAAPTPVKIPCKCLMMSCLGTQFPNINKLMLHLRKKHAGEVVECIFENCKMRFSNPNSLKSHFSQKHLKLNLCNLKVLHKLGQDIISDQVFPNNFQTISDTDNELEINVADSEINSPAGEDFEEEEDHNDSQIVDDLDEFFLMAYCDFLNRLSNFHFVPQTTIKIIGDEYLKNYTKSNAAKSASLKKSLEKVPGISQSEIDRVLDEFQSQDKFLKAQTDLDTEYKRNKFIKNKFTFVAPQEIVLNPKEVKEAAAVKEVLHYVPIIESFKNLVQDPTFIDMKEKNIANDGSNIILKDVKDGELYKNSSYFQQNPGAYTMMIYSDAIELGMALKFKDQFETCTNMSLKYLAGFLNPLKWEMVCTTSF